jgi:hypothetical protein
MSFRIDYQPFFFVALEEQNTGKILTDLVLQPTAACRQLLANRHMIFKARENGGQVFFQKNPLADDPLLGRISERIQFSFILSLKRTDFFELYKPDLSIETGPHLYFDNLTISGNIQAKDSLTIGNAVQASDAIRITPSVFVERIDVSDDPPPTFMVVQRIFDPPTIVPDVPIPSSTGTNQVQTKINLTSFPSGVYSVTTNQPDAKINKYYIDDEIASQRAIGVVDIFWEDSQDTAPEGGVPYVIRFEKR